MLPVQGHCRIGGDCLATGVGKLSKCATPQARCARAELSSPGKYARKTGGEVGSELSLALLTTIREAVASRAGSAPSLNVSPPPSCTWHQDTKTQPATYATSG